MVEKLKVRHPGFSSRLQSAAKKKQLSTSHIRAELKVTYEMARRYWLGIAIPRGKRLKQLATLVGESAAWLEHGEAAAPQTTLRDAEGLSPEAIEIARAWQKLDPVNRASFREQIFYISSIQSVARWLVIQKPRSPRYDAWEGAVQSAMDAELKQMKLNLDT